MNAWKLLRSLLWHILLGRGGAPVYVVLSPVDDTALENRVAEDKWVIEEVIFEPSSYNEPPFFVAVTIEEGT